MAGEELEAGYRLAVEHELLADYGGECRTLVQVQCTRCGAGVWETSPWIFPSMEGPATAMREHEAARHP